MKRRQLLMTGTVGLATSLAGCGSLGGGDGDGDSLDSESGSSDDVETESLTGPAEFEEVSLTAPESVTVGSPVSLTVSATNTGGTAGTYEGTVRMESSSGGTQSGSSETPSFESSFAIEDIPPGETGETEITGPSFETVDDYEFTVADTSVTVRPEPQMAAVGETLALGDDLSVTVDDVTVQESVFYPTSRSSGLSTYEEIASFGAPSNHVLAVVTVTAENTGTETTSAERGTLGINDAEWYGGGEGSPGSVLGRSDSRFYDGGLPEIDPSGSVTGYYLAKVPRETARGTLEITGQADAHGTLPERVWAVEPEGDERPLPQLTLESVDAPDTTALGRDYEITITVTNEGDAAGTLRGVTQWDDDGSWAQLSTATSHADLATDRSTSGVIVRELDPGASTDVTISNFSVYNSQHKYRFQPFGDEWQVTFEEAVLSMGDQLKSNGNANIVVADLRTQDTVTAYDDFSEEEFEAEPDDGNQFVAVQFRFTKRNENADYAETPSTSDFSLVVDGTNVSSSTYIDDEIRESWYTPIDGDLEDQPEVGGWDFYEVPTEYAAGEFDIHFEESAGFGSSVSTTATWTQ